VGFRIIPGLGERVIYREMFPQGLTMIDSREFGSMGIGHVAARQELREMMAALQLPDMVGAAAVAEPDLPAPDVAA
jgi:chromosome partitioning protein